MMFLGGNSQQRVILNVLFCRLILSADGGAWLAELEVLVESDTVGLLLACVRAGTAILSQGEVVTVEDPGGLRLR